MSGAATIGLGIDAGGSGTRWLLRGPDGDIAAGLVAPLSGHLFDPERRREAERAVAALAAAALAHARPTAVVAGITGLDHRGPEQALLGALLATALGLREEAVELLADIGLAYLGAFAPGEGILLYAGTGSVAYHLTAAGRELRAGGHGYIIDDAGGGYFLGRQALRRIVRARDERDVGTPPSLLEERICERIGGESWDALRAYVYGGGRSAVAALAPAVAAAAAQNDEDALRILEEAGGELARLARVLLTRIGARVPVGFAGGVSGIGGRLDRALRAGLPPGVELRPVRDEPVAAAARLAFEAAATAP